MSDKVKISVSREVAERLKAIVREKGGVDDDSLATTIADEAITSYLDDDSWDQEIQRLVDMPRHEQLFVEHDQVGEWIRSHRTATPQSMPEGKSRS